MNTSNIYVLKDCSLYFNITSMESFNIVSALIKKGRVFYRLIDNYALELTHPSVELEAQYDEITGFTLILTESGLEWTDTALKIVINPKCGFASVLYGKTNETTTLRIN